MLIEIDGQQYDVPDNATPAHIQKALGLHAPQQQEPRQPTSYRESIAKSLQDAVKGGGIGLFQGLSDVGANIAQFPSDIYSYATGKQGYQAPKPNFRDSIPQSGAGQAAASIGEFAAPMALPGFGAEAAGSKLLPKLLVGAGFGAAESENRPLGALLGGAFGAAPLAKELPLTKGMAAKPLNYAEKLIQERGIKKLDIPKDIFKEAKDFLPKNLPSKKLLEKAKNGDYKTLFTLQSDIGKSARQLTKSASGAERLHGFQANDLRQRLLDAMKGHLNKEGHEDISQLIAKGQNKYRQHMKLRPIAKKALYATGIGTAIPGYQILKNILF
jgi:hypothetical protein